MSLTETQRAEIESRRSELQSTRRATVSALEEILYEALPVLDHGFIRVVDYMGDDAAIAQAARVSYGRGTKKANEDAGLVKYLMRHRHTSPFEMCDIKLHVKLPIFVARQWIRHRTASVNEYSARYSILSDEFYIPALEHMAMQSTDNKQGRGDLVHPQVGETIRQEMREKNTELYRLYRDLLTDAKLARELSRIVLPTSGYTEWYWKINLHNLLHFLSLRADPHAQYEIRAYAEIIERDIVQKWVPVAHAAFLNYRMKSQEFSGEMMELLYRMLRGESVSQETSGLSKGEWAEFQAKLPKSS